MQFSNRWTGDIIQVGSNATRVMSHWGNVLEQAVAESAQPKDMKMFDKTGRVLLHAPLPTEFSGFPVLYSNRGLLQRLILEYARSIGVEFRFGERVREYFEEKDGAGIVIGEERIKADGVVAADGIHSLARKHVIGIQQHPRTSGFAVYRTCFSLDLLANDPLTQPLTELKEDMFRVWLDTDVHAILFILAKVRQVVIFCTHKVGLSR